MKNNVVDIPVNIFCFFKHAEPIVNFKVYENETNNVIEIFNFGKTTIYYVDFLFEINSYKYYHVENKIFFEVNRNKDLLYFLNLR